MSGRNSMPSMNCTHASILFVSLAIFGCNTLEDVSGLWQEPPCQQSPCNQRAKLHLGQYGDSIAGIVTWYRTLEGINTFNQPAFACGCDYIQAGTVGDGSVRFATLPANPDCEVNPTCNPCKCDDYEVRLELGDDDKLTGQLVCADGTFYPIELERAIGLTKGACDDAQD